MGDIVERLREGVWGRARRADAVIQANMQEGADEIERLRAERDRLREALQWFVDNDDTNEGDEPLYDHGGLSWDEINAYWIAGLNRARAALGEDRA